SLWPVRARLTAGSEKEDAVVSQDTEFSDPLPKMPAKDVRAYGGTPSVRKWPRVFSATCSVLNASATRAADSSQATGSRPALNRSALILSKTACLTESLGRSGGG